ncbi:hypothetical protein D5301_21750 [Stenotrophomonas sp. MH181796]|uniref:hypothetical protein n=1 Tax=Stenotrophomonas sp. MH181796 TaxID=2339228 RepID=UPI00129C8556|nr:hypothetical protein [Stenotrophomonas sp. MH181796]MRI44829.1 hypothetical protein [Stenotrophomonas sp. MH181796]
MAPTLEELAARLEACQTDLEAHRGYIKGLEYGIRALIAAHPEPKTFGLTWELALVAAAETHLGNDGPVFTAAIQQALRTLTCQTSALA